MGNSVYAHLFLRTLKPVCKPARNLVVFFLILLQAFSFTGIVLAQSIASDSAQLSSEIPKLDKPFTGDYPVTKGFGAEEEDPRLPKLHNGVDFALPEGTEVLAVDSGEVVIAGEGDYGITVKIKHSWGESIYGHLSRLTSEESEPTSEVSVGDKVLKGEVIALSGSTGISTGPHLHLGIKNSLGEFVDPLLYLPSVIASDSEAILNQIATSSATPHNDVLGEATASATLTSEVGSDSSEVLAQFEDVSNDPAYLFNYKFNLSNGRTVHFWDKKTNRPSFAVADGEYEHKLRFFLKSTLEESSPLARPPSEVLPKVDGNKIEFPVVIRGIPMTLRYTVSEDKVKEEFIIDQKPSDAILSSLEEQLNIPFEVSTDGLSISKNNKEYVFRSNGWEYWRVAEPTLEDSAGQKGQVSLEFTSEESPSVIASEAKQSSPENNKIATSSATEVGTPRNDNKVSAAILSVDANFLKTASYPVIIDPTVFTAGMAKRDAPGPFTTAPIIQGPVDTSAQGDALSLSRGTQVANNFYANLDSDQGSIVFWITPEWNGNDGVNHTIFWGITGNSLMIAKESNNNLTCYAPGSPSVSVSVSSWTAGTTYSIACRWDTRNTLDGTNYVSLSINDTTTFGGSSSPTQAAPASSIIIGTRGNTTQSANALIEGLTVYRRPLYDGTNGINVGNGDEINLIYNSGTGKDPTLITGSWDVVFALPTNQSTGALTTGTGNAWTHPHASNLIPGNSSTGGFMLNGTYTTDGWADEGTPTSVAALATTEKIFAGGYKFTSDAANEGIYQDITVTAGDDWVVRAVAHSDATCQPKIILYDQTNLAEIGSLTGTTTSTRTAPDVFVLTGEAPASSTTLRVKLINTAASGTCYFHQAEVLANRINKPSLEAGSGDPWVPTGWTGLSLGAGEGVQETTIVHSGSSSFKVNVPTTSTSQDGISQIFSAGAVNDYFSGGGWMYESSGAVQFDNDHNIMTCQNNPNSGSACILNATSASWKHSPFVNREKSAGWSPYFRFIVAFNSSGVGYLDDVYVFPLTAVSLTVTPAIEANSTENTDEIRVDGRDTYVETDASSLGTTSGFASFNWRPRHAAADAVKFAETTSDDAYIVSFAGDSDDYINVYWDSANTIAMAYSMAGTTASSTWDATSAIDANTEYAVEVAYTGGGDMTLKVGGTTRITLSSIPSAFGTAPNDAYFGSNTSSANQGDATFSSIVFDNTAPSISLTALTPDPNSDTTPTVSGTATEAIGTVSTVQFQMDSTAGSWTACTADDGTFDEASEAFSCTPSALSEGSHTMYVRATDSNSNTTSSGSESSDVFTIDSIAPTVSVTAITDPTTDSTPAVTGTATDATTVLTAIQFQVDSTSGSWTTCTADDGTIDETSEAFSCTTSALSDGSHTIYIRTTDSASNTTALADYGTDTFTVDATAPTTPGTPSTTTPTTDTTPTWTWTASIDAGQGLHATETYTVQWSTDSSFASVSSGTSTTNSFTHSTALAEGTWYFRVKAKDTLDNESSYSSSGSVEIDTTAPGGVDLDSPGDSTFTSNSRPTFRWKAASGLSKYKFEINNGTGGDISIDNISTSGTSDVETSRYLIQYDNFSDSDSDNNYISIYTKSSSQWSTGENDGKLREGKRTWQVTSYDSADNTTSASRTLYADYTSPSFSKISLENLGEKNKYLLVTDLTFSGTIDDNLAVDKIEVRFNKENYLLGIRLFDTTSTYTYDLKNTANATSLTFSFSPKNIDFGKYQLEVVGVDKAGNKSGATSYIIQFLSEEAAKRLLADDKEKQKELREKSKISLPGLEKQARLHKEIEASELSKLIAWIKEMLGKLGVVGEYLAGIWDRSAQRIQLAFDYWRGIGRQIARQGEILADNIRGQTDQLLKPLTNQLASLNNLDVGVTTKNRIAKANAETKEDFFRIINPLLVWIPAFPSAMSSGPNGAGMTEEVVRIAQGAVEAILISKDSHVASLLGMTKQVNQAVNSQIASSGKHVREQIARTQGGILDTIPQLTAMGGVVQSLAQKTGENFQKTIKSVIVTTSNDINNISTELAENTLKSINSTQSHIRGRFFVALRMTTAKVEQAAARMGKGVNRLNAAGQTFFAILFDEQPTTIANVTIEEIGPDYAVISWETNHYARGKVNYGQDLSYGEEVFLKEYKKRQTARLTGLEKGKRYYFEVMSYGKNYTYDAYYSFEIPGE